MPCLAPNHTMAQIYNSDLTKGIAQNAGIQISREVVPTQLAEKVVPVMETNPALLRVCNFIRGTEANNATSATAYTTLTDRDTYLTAVTLSVQKDVTSTSVKSYARVVIDGANKDICVIAGITLTAQSSTMTLILPAPLKVDRGSALTVLNTTNVANISAAVVFYGYTVENIKA